MLYGRCLIELENDNEEQYGLERLIAYTQANGFNLSSTQLHDHLLAELDIFKGSQQYTDDVSVMAVKCRF